MVNSPQGHDRWAREKELLEQEVQRIKALLDVQVQKERLNNDLYILSIQEAENLKWKAKATEAQAENRDKVIALLKNELTRSESILNGNNEVIGQLTKEHQNILTQFHNQQEQIKELQAQCSKLEIDVKDKAVCIKTSTISQGLPQSASQRQLITERESPAETIEKLDVLAGLQESKVTAAQTMTSPVKKKNKTTHETMHDEEIRKLIENDFRVQIDGWTMRWANHDLNLMAEVYKSASLRKEIEKIVRTEGLRYWLQGVKPGYVVDALLSQYICEKIFRQPLHRLGTTFRTPEIPTDQFVKSETDVHDWRSRTLQRLNQMTPPGSSCPGGALMEQLEDAQRRLLKSLAAAFLEGPIRPLLRQVGRSIRKPIGQKRRELLKVLRDASNLDFHLWEQCGLFKTIGIEYFKDKAFRCDSLEMEAHRFHNLDDNDHNRDGERIMMVSHQAFLTFGNENGKGDDGKKVWAKAVV